MQGSPPMGKGLTGLVTYIQENPRQDYSVPGKGTGDEKVHRHTQAQSMINSSDYSRSNQNHLIERESACVRKGQETNPESCADHSTVQGGL